MANGDFHARQLALIKSARSLDSDTRPHDEKISDIWHLLSAAKGGKSCAAEETILRWLLKHMDGGNETAEQLRRYPLTWTTLGCLFERISLFSLSKVFLERKFIVVLQQSAKDISKPQLEDKTNLANDRKRKRNDPVKFDIMSLRSPEALTLSASELFGAINKLLNRLNATTTQDAEDVLIGAEHIKSIFRIPAEDAKELVAPLLWICAHSLNLLHLHGGLFEEQEQWPKVLISVWDLHLGSAEDPREFASHLYYPCCIIIDKLLDANKVLGNLDRKRSWRSQLEQLVAKNLVNPARNAFINSNGLAILDLANTASGADPAACVHVLWRIVGQTQRATEDPSTKRAHLTWTQSVFKLLLSFAEEHKLATTVVAQLLSWARLNGYPPELDTLSHIYKNYCCQSLVTDWALVSDIISCDSDVFLLNRELLDTLLDRVTSASEGNEAVLKDTVEGVINQLMKAFAKARDLISFVKKWHTHLSQLLAKGGSLETTSWYDRRAREQFAKIMQGALSVQQVSTLVDWLQTQDDNGASLVILDAICQGVKDEAYIASLSPTLFEIVLRPVETLKRQSAPMASWWRVTSSTASWVSAPEVNRLWGHVKGSLSTVLSKGPLSDTATLEAFGCCSRLCLSNFPHGTDLNDSLLVSCAFLKRVTDEAKDAKRVPALFTYLELIFSYFPILSKASSGDEQISNLVGILFNRLESHMSEYQLLPYGELIKQVPRDDVIADEEELTEALIRPLVAALEAPDECGWTSISSESTISTLLTFPPEAFTKDRRKRIMSSWKKWKSDIIAHANNPRLYKLSLRLVLLVMAQPTFYDHMCFDDISDLPLHSSSDFSPFVERLAQLMISQMIGISESSADYGKQMLQYLEALDIGEVSEPGMPTILLKSMVNALKGSTPKAKQALDQEYVTEKLRELISHSISELSSKLKKPEKLAKDEQSLLLLDLALRASGVIGDSLSSKPIKLSSKVVARLQDAGEALTTTGIPVGWKLQTFLALNQKVPDSAALLKQMNQSYSANPDSQSVSDFVDAVIKKLDNPAKLQLLYEALKDTAGWKSSSVPQMIMARIIENIQVSTPVSIIVEGEKTFDLASVQIILSQSLTRETISLEQFRQTAQLVELLLDKHASSMTQINVEHTLSIVGTVCASSGPESDEPDSMISGEVFDALYRLVAIIIRRHRLRLEGHHHLLLSTLQSLLRVLLADPAKSKQTDSSFLHPPWLDARLKARHGTKFTRLITLTCEPSAASVARSKHNSLDSATDAVKRSAGQHMFWIIALYIKLQLEGDVSREMRKELAMGVYSILSITPENNRRILNEAIDESGRTIFRSLFTEWKKFGKWSGV